jgi:hypothetical protein
MQFNAMGWDAGKWVLFSWLRALAHPHDYVLVLDGDDFLLDARVLREVRERLEEKKPWFAW